MNPELRQRLLGAVVVTALAAIFLPMFFDEPVDNSGQSVTELGIPATPIKPNEDLANKVPANAKQVLKPTTAGSDEANETTEEEPAAQAAKSASDTEIQNDADMSADLLKKKASKQKSSSTEADTEAEEESLDTGVVEGAKPDTNKPEHEHVKQSTKWKPVEPHAVIHTKPPVKEVQNFVPEKKADKVHEHEHEAATKPKKPEIHSIATKPTIAEPVVKPKPPIPVNDKPVKSETEIKHWYIQAGSFTQKEHALALSKTLREQGLPVRVETTKTPEKGKTIYEVKVGSRLDKKRVDAIKLKLEKQNINSSVIAE